MSTSTADTKNSPVMKILLWSIMFVLIASLAGFSYYQFQTIKKNNQQISMLGEEKTALESEKQTLNSTISTITATIEEVAIKLQDVRQKHVTITALTTQMTEGSQKDQIINEINAIESQLERDKREINDINQKLQASGVRIKSLENLIVTLKKEIAGHVEQVENLRSIVEHKNEVLRTAENTIEDTQRKLSSVRTELDVTSEKVTDLNETVNSLIEQNNTAYYVTGTKNELVEKNILDEKGWFVFNRNIDLSSDINENSFDKIDITKQNEFRVASGLKKVTIIPERSITSYSLQEIDDNQSVLKVTDPESFWKIKYVAVVVKG